MTISGKQKPVLFAALNWGMGHASRSVPLIRELQKQGVPVILASDGVAADLLRAEFPAQEVHELPSYNVQYRHKNIYINVLRSLWTILTAIWKEHQWLRKFVRQHHIQAIISDNRYGIRHVHIPSMLITHQFRFYGPWKWANKIGEWSVRWWARKYNEIWVPDWAGSESLTGGMADWRYVHPPVYYLGPLSRFHVVQERPSAKQVDILVILSGPEPQRTQLEVDIHRQLQRIPGNHVLIRGTKDQPHPEINNPYYTRHDLLAAELLIEFVNQSTMQISRSGYSTVMDLTYSGIPALMIPTPGQIEQEFLMDYLQDRGPWIFQTQENLDITAAWETLDQWSNTQSIRPSGKEASNAITSFLQRWTPGPIRSI